MAETVRRGVVLAPHCVMFAVIVLAGGMFLLGRQCVGVCVGQVLGETELPRHLVVELAAQLEHLAPVERGPGRLVLAEGGDLQLPQRRPS